MRVLLIQPKFPLTAWAMKSMVRVMGLRTPLPPLGLITVAAILPSDWEFRLVDLNARELTEEDWAWAEHVMVSAMIIQRDSFLGTIREAKRRNKMVIAGGPFPTSVPEEAMDAGCDILVRGELENQVHDLLAAIDKGDRQVVETRERPDIRMSPVPRYDLLELDNYLAIGVQTSRGCPHDCEFCDIVNLYGRKPRYKLPGQLLGELETLFRLGWRGEVFIADDNFIGSRKNCHALLTELIRWNKGHGMPFFFNTQASLKLGQDTETIDLMTEAGFSWVFVGIESPDEEVLKLSDKLHNIRNPIVESLQNLCRNGLSVMASFVMGFDGERTGVGDRIAALVDKSSVPLVALNTLIVLPNTRLWKRLQQEGRLLDTTISGDFTAGGFNFVPQRPPEEIMSEFRRTWDYVHDPSRFVARNAQWHLDMRPTRKAMARQAGKPIPSDSVPPALRPLGRRIMMRLSFLYLCWTFGVKASSRFLFWKKLVEMVRKNPSRLNRYIHVLFIGKDLVDLRSELHRGTV